MGFFGKKKKQKEPVRQGTGEDSPTGERRRRKAPRGESSQERALARHGERVNGSARVQAQNARLAALVQVPGPAPPSTTSGGGALLSLDAWKERQRKLKEAAPSREAWDAERGMRELEWKDLKKAHRKQAKRDRWVEAELSKHIDRVDPTHQDVVRRREELRDDLESDLITKREADPVVTRSEPVEVAEVADVADVSEVPEENFVPTKLDESEVWIDESASESSESSLSSLSSMSSLSDSDLTEESGKGVDRSAPYWWLPPEIRREELYADMERDLLRRRQVDVMDHDESELGSDESDSISALSETIELSEEERAELWRQVDVILTGVKDVQKRFTGESLPGDVQAMQRKLRDHARGKKDSHDRRVLSNTEVSSEGWALLPMIAVYAAYDRGKDLPRGYAFKTRYMFDAGDDLGERRGQRLGAEQRDERAQAVIRYTQGQWVNAAGATLDSTGLGVNAQAVNERKEKLGEVRNEIAIMAQNAKWSNKEELAATLAAWLKKVDDKFQVTRLNQHKSVQGKFIFVMDAAGEFYAVPGEQWVVHHSSLLAGGAVAVAGEMGLEDGRLTSISNVSGHYKPSPAYLWQAVKQLDMLGVPLDDVAVYVAGVKSYFRSARDFLAAMDPGVDASLFDPRVAIARLNGITSAARQRRRAVKLAGDGGAPR